MSTFTLREQHRRRQLGRSSGKPSLSLHLERHESHKSDAVLNLPVSPGPNHDGGFILFGPDRKLYVVIGDLNRDGKLQNFPGGAAPDDTSVIFRLNPDGSTPGDNPFFSQGGNVARYFAYGIRNSFGMTLTRYRNTLDHRKRSR